MPRPQSPSHPRPRSSSLHRLTDKISASRTVAHTHIRERAAFYALLFAGLLITTVAAWPFVHAHLEAIAILDQVAGKPVPRFIRHVVSFPVASEDLTLTVESGQVRARLYTPAGHPNAPALVVLHGVHHLGIDEPRLIAFARSMASCGIEVLTPELPDIKDYHVDSTSTRTIGESVQWFAHRTGSPVGVMGLSFSGGLALVAAADPLYHPWVKFVLAVGSQDSMGRVAQYYITNQDARPNASTELLPAHEYGPLVLEYEYLEDFVPSRDVPAIRAVLRAHLYEDKPAETRAEAALTPSQHIASTQLMDATSTKTRALIAQSNLKHADELRGLSPDPYLRTYTTPVYLLHGQGDNIIPSAETLWMASELPSETLQAALVSPVISHIDLDGPSPGPLDNWRLIHFFALIMHAIQTPTGKTPMS